MTLSIAHSTGVTSIPEKILRHYTCGSGETQGTLQKWILTVSELENRSTSSRHSSVTMISFHMAERAFESSYIALLIARLNGVTSTSKKVSAAAKLAHRGLEKLKNRLFWILAISEPENPSTSSRHIVVHNIM